jgi:hypothetical protein
MYSLKSIVTLTCLFLGSLPTTALADGSFPPGSNLQNSADLSGATHPDPFSAYQQRYGSGAVNINTSAPFKATSTTAAAQTVSPSMAQTPSEAGSQQRAELTLSTIYNNDPSSNVNGGTSYGIDTTIYSATIQNNWRIFAGELYSHEAEPFGEGAIGYNRGTAGVEYRNDSITAINVPAAQVT